MENPDMKRVIEINGAKMEVDLCDTTRAICYHVSDSGRAMSDLSFLAEAGSPEETQDALAQVMGLVDRWLDSVKRLEEAEEAFNKAKALESRMREVELPELMRANRLSSVVLENGATVSVEELIELAVPKEDVEKRKAALSWLSSNGAADLIKDTLFVVDPPRWLVEKLAEEGVEYGRDKVVDSRSLKAWMKGALGLKKGTIAQFKPEDVAPELGLYRHFTTKVKGV